MFDIGFSEIMLTSVIALLVLGPEKLPRVANQVGRWVGRARAMARQFREQLEEEVNLENVRKAHKEQARRGAEASDASGSTVTEAVGVIPSPQIASAESGDVQPPADTFSHAHPTNELGANPHTPNGAAEAPTQPEPTHEPAAPELTPLQTAQATPDPTTPTPPSASESEKPAQS